MLKLAAWLVLAVIVFSTLAPIGLRPETGFSPNLERAGAYALFGFVFALAYPRRLWLAIGIIVVSAVGLELAQYLVATRHARLADAGFKLLGGGVGLGAGLLLVRGIWPARKGKA